MIARPLSLHLFNDYAPIAWRGLGGVFDWSCFDEAKEAAVVPVALTPSGQIAPVVRSVTLPRNKGMIIGPTPQVLAHVRLLQQRRRLRQQALQLLAVGMEPAAVAQQCDVSIATVRIWRHEASPAHCQGVRCMSDEGVQARR